MMGLDLRQDDREAVSSVLEGSDGARGVGAEDLVLVWDATEAEVGGRIFYLPV